MRLFIWEGNGVSCSYHDDGTLVVLAETAEEARERVELARAIQRAVRPDPHLTQSDLDDIINPDYAFEWYASPLEMAERILEALGVREPKIMEDEQSNRWVAIEDYELLEADNQKLRDALVEAINRGADADRLAESLASRLVDPLARAMRDLG